MADRNDRGYMTEEELARKRAYEEYLSLRENRSHRQENIKDDTLYGEYITNNHNQRQHQEVHHGSGGQRSYEETMRVDGRHHRDAAGAHAGQRAHAAQPKHEKKAAPKKHAPIAEPGGVNRADKLTRKERKAAGGGGGKKLRRATIIVAALAILLGGVIAVGLTVVKSTLDNIGKVELDPDMIGIDPQVDQDLSGFRNIAILGIDARDMSNDAGSRSDSMIITSINTETDEIQMFSVYRDTMLDLGEGTPGLDKVTHAYYYGGPTKALYALNYNLDLNIKEVVVVNWKAVADAIDALGGIEVEIKESEIQQMNKYIVNTAKHIGGSKDLIEGPGKQTLNGVQAVTYARIRKDAATGDYRRNERMKIVVKAAFEKAKHMDYSQLKKITKTVLPEIKTNMSTADIMGMIVKLNSFDMTSSSTGWPYDVGSWTGDAWYGPPVTLSSNVTKLHEDFFGQENYTPTEHVQEISSRISAKTGLY